MQQIMLWILLGASVFGLIQSAPQELSDAERQAIAAVRAVAQKIENCPPTEQVAEFRKKWVKVSWGPPKEMKFDVEKTDSLLAPYKGIIAFSIPYSNGEQHKTKQDAQDDKSLTALWISPVKYTLRISRDSSVQVESMQIQNTFSGAWENYNPVSPERFCWIAAVR